VGYEPGGLISPFDRVVAGGDAMRILTTEVLLPSELREKRGTKGPRNDDGLDHGIFFPGAQLRGLAGCSVIGRAFVYDREAEKLVFEAPAGEPFFPPYVKILAENSDRTWTGSRYHPLPWVLDNFHALQPIRLEQCFTVLHYNLVYGHFLGEMLPKLFLLKRLNQAGRRCPLAFPLDTVGWLKSMVRELLPEVPLIEFDPNTQRIDADELFVICGDTFLASEGIIGDFADFSGRSARADRRIFLVRPENHASRRQWRNEIDMAEIARKSGFEVVEPGSLGGLKAQARLFGAASHVVGEFTSALHNAVFSPPGSRVLAINRVNIYQWLIANSIGQYLDYVLPVGGAVSWDADQDFLVDTDLFHDAFESLVAN
jgi:hypothetical protein